MEPSAALLFAIGLFGSAHCVGMCGGIAGALALSLPVACRQDPYCLARYLAAYNLGRIASYSIAGALGGLIGSALSGAGRIPEVHELIRILGALVVFAAGLYMTGWVPQLKQMDRLGNPVWRRLAPVGRRLLPVHKFAHACLYGAIWGWLPCGLVYYALVLTLAADDPGQGAFFMLLFGLGTLPALAVVGSAAGLLASIAANRIWQRAAGLVLMAAGVLGLLFGNGML